MAILATGFSLSIPVAGHSEQLPSALEAGEWDTPEALELVARARLARAMRAASSELQSYTAHTEGHVYFFLDPEQAERYLIRIDQLAAEIQWQSPDRLHQHIVGERSETRLPVRDFAYYLDRFTLVPHGFGDEIRIGSGLDVAGVEHPMAAWRESSTAAELYHFRLGNSLSVFVAGREEPVRIQEVFVEPRDLARPGILGTIHLDMATASIVRMAFTFTPASYVDPRNDRILVELDYGLWEGRHWLPNLQRIEVRREMPALDLGVGTVIRAVLQVRDYELDSLAPASTSAMPAVTFRPVAERQAFPFSTGLYDQLAEHGLGELVVARPQELRSLALEWAGSAASSGLSPIRLHFPEVSSLLRYNRAEGARLGAGVSFRPRAATRIRANAGYALGSSRPQGALTLEEILAADWMLGVRAGLRDRAELGLAPGSSPLVSTLGALLKGEDYLDPYWVSGGRFWLEYQGSESARFSLGLGVERHTAASRALDRSPLGSRPFRPVRPIARGEFFRLDAGVELAGGAGGSGSGRAKLSATALRGQEGGGIGILATLDERWAAAGPSRELQFTGTGWVWLGDPLPQGHRLLGGRGTLPGHPYRSLMGDMAATGAIVGSSDLVGPLVRARAGLHIGWSEGGSRELRNEWEAESTHGILGAASVGLGLGWDLLRVDLARGIGGGEWQLWFSLDPRLWSRL